MKESTSDRERPVEVMTEQEIRRVTVGEPLPVNGPITLVPYDPEWPALYAQESTRIREALGVRVVQLEHIGSTAVPGLTAKPIIDIMLIVEDSGDEDAYVPALNAAGYILRIREPDWDEHRCLKGPDTNVNLHVWSRGARQIQRHLRFRDRLRTNDADRERYAETKIRLAAQDWTFVQNYADAKNDVIDEIMRRAQS